MRVNGRGGEGGDGRRCLYRRLFAKILANMKVESPVDQFVTGECDHLSKRKMKSPNFYAQAPLIKQRFRKGNEY